MRHRLISPTRRPCAVNRRSALSIRNWRRNSAREVNIRYGSFVPFEIKSSIRIAVYPSVRSRISGGSCLTCNAALIPAISPWHAASSYPLVPLICPARKRPAIFLVSRVRSQFRRIDRVVLNRVSRTHHLRGLKTWNRLDDRELNINRQRRAHAIHVNFMRVQPFWLEEELVHQLVRKLHDLVFDRRTIPRPGRLNLPAVHRGAMDVLADYSVRLLGRKRDVTGNLTVMVRDLFRAKTERRGIDVTWLDLEPRPINRAPIKSRGRACLQTASAQAEILQRLAQAAQPQAHRSVLPDIAARRNESIRSEKSRS